jgi:hypothetical protein
MRELLKDLSELQHDPLGFVMWAFPWGEPGTSLADETGPDEWQRNQLLEIGRRLSDDPYTVIQEAIASGHGIGKSTEVAWLALWAVMTFPDCRGVVTANTETQLRTKTWPEVSKWFALLRFAELREMFDLQATSIASTSQGHEKTWRIDAIPWSERNTEAFAGLHNAGRRAVIIFDEGSAILDKIWEVAEGALTDAETEMLWLVYGNPTRNTGRFRDCFSKHRHLWRPRQIDSRTVKRTNKQRLAEMIQTYGLDSDIVKVRILGQFPSASSAQLIPVDVVQSARTRVLPPPLVTDPIIFGVDCARFGDDHSTLAIRCGRDARTRPWKRWFQQDTMQVAGDVALEAQMWKPDAIFVDVGNIGGGVIDRLRQLLKGSVPVFEVNFGGPGREVDWENNLKVRTVNKRSEIWLRTRAWLKGGGCIPDEQAIEDDLAGPEYSYDAGETAIQLERKVHMKARGQPSPDDGDALACTFAEPVAPRLPRHKDPLSYIEPGANYDRYAELG